MTDSCTTCGLPATRRSVTLASDGVCSVCRAHQIKESRIDWDARREALRKIADAVRGTGPYDAVVPFGGGKDGAYTLYYLTRVLNLSCLAVTLDNRFLRKHAWQNCAAVLENLGVDQIIFRPPFSLVKSTMRSGFELAGTLCWHCNAGIAAFPMRVAVSHGAPLVVYAHSSAEYHSYPGRTYADAPEGDVVDEEYQTLSSGLSFERMAAALPEADQKSLQPFRFPDQKTLERAGVQSIFLSNYVFWDERSQAATIERELGWQGGAQEGVPEDFGYEKVDCYLVGARDYLRYIQEGYGRGARLGAMEVRLGRLTRDEAIAMAKRTDGRRPASLDRVLGLLQVDEEVFLDGAISYAEPSRDFDVEEVERGVALEDAEDMPG